MAKVSSSNTKAEILKAYDELYEGPDYNELQRDVDWALARLEAYAASRAV